MIMPVHSTADLYQNDANGTSFIGESSLAQRVRIRLLLEPGLPAESIRCHVFSGTAVLCGVVESFRVKQQAQDALRRVPGLSLILNELIVYPRQTLEPRAAAAG
jgi:osmotically-inducible protein OsmY